MTWLAALLLLAWVLKTSADERAHRLRLYAQRQRFEHQVEHYTRERER